MAITKGIINTGNINSTGQVIAPGIVNSDSSNRKNNQLYINTYIFEHKHLLVSI